MNIDKLSELAYYKNNFGYFINDDCLSFMKKLDDCCVDLTVTSPPYDNLRKYNGYYFDFENIAKELFRITKDGGVVVWNVNDATINGSETGTSFRQALFFMDCGFNLHDTMIWVKDGGGAIGSNKCYTQNFEYMFVLSKGKPKSVNLIYDKPNGSYKQNNTALHKQNGRRKPNGEIKVEIRKPPKEYSKRNNWWYIPVGGGKTGHPAVFPEQLAKDHIISWSNIGDVVFDPFLGSGTTAKMAIETGRKFLGCEISEEYCEIIKNRLDCD